MSNGQEHAGGGGHGGVAKTYFYFVDGKKFDWPQATITGAQIRAAIPGLNPTFQIVLEGHADQQDQPISDSDTFQLEVQGRGPLQFYTAPPATFGATFHSES